MSDSWQGLEMMGTRAGMWGKLETLRMESTGVRMSAGGKGERRRQQKANTKLGVGFLVKDSKDAQAELSKSWM